MPQVGVHAPAFGPPNVQRGEACDLGPRRVGQNFLACVFRSPAMNGWATEKIGEIIAAKKFWRAPPAAY